MIEQINFLKYFGFLFFALIPFIYTTAQNSISYDYDDSGNRISRVLYIEEMGKGATSYQSENNKIVEQDLIKEELQKSEENTVIKIYPNPTRGILKVEISGQEELVNSGLMLYDLSGIKLIDKINLPLTFELDINRYRNGTYILKIVINNTITNWKIIKNKN